MLTAPRPDRKHPRRERCAGALLCVSLLVAGCAPDKAGAPPPPDTVGRPSGPGGPGDLVDVQTLSTPAGATEALRITYRSVDVLGEDSLVTGMVILPKRRAADRGVVLWAHATTGTGDACAPSSSTGPESVAELSALLAAGWVVVATDYEGLGALGPHPYLVRDSQARALWDSLRAAQQLEGDAVRPDDPVALWGFSQGGHAALAAAELAEQMAPAVDLRGAAAAAPVSDVTAFLARSAQPTQLGVALSILRGAALAAPELRPEDVLTDAGLAVYTELDELCIAEAIIAADQPVDAILRLDPTENLAWREALDAQRVGDAPIRVPVLLLQGVADQIIPAEDTQALHDRLCAADTRSLLVERAGQDHGVQVQPDLTTWLAGRFSGEPAPETC